MTDPPEPRAGGPDWLPSIPRRAYPATLKIVLIVVVVCAVLVSCSVVVALI